MTRSSKKHRMQDDIQPDTASTTNKGPQQKSLGAFFPSKKSKPGNTAAVDQVVWKEIGKTWMGKWGSPSASSKFAAFDLDFTLIAIKGKGRFPKDANDWRFFHPQVPQLLQKLHETGYRIVIISNQNGLKPGKDKAEISKKGIEYRTKINNIARALNVPFTIFAAIDKDYMRKPSPGMWHLAQLDNDMQVDKASSFFVGDAAGRPKGWCPGAIADFSDSDLAFARNVGVPFYTPEEIFGKCDPENLQLPEPQEWPIVRFAPRKFAPNLTLHNELMDSVTQHIEAAKEAKRGLLIMLVGPPACGKSTFTHKHLLPLGCERVNMDELKTRKKCEDAVRNVLKTNGLAVIDNTNADEAARSPFIAIASENSAECIAVIFEHESRDLAMHNNSFRTQLVQARYFNSSDISLYGVPSPADRVPEVAYHSFFKRLSLPSTAEGFSKVLQHTFVPVFESVEDENLWRQYY